MLKKKKYLAYVSKHTSNHEKVILLMISNGALFFNDLKQSKNNGITLQSRNYQHY